MRGMGRAFAAQVQGLGVQILGTLVKAGAGHARL